MNARSVIKSKLLIVVLLFTTSTVYSSNEKIESNDVLEYFYMEICKQDATVLTQVHNKENDLSKILNKDSILSFINFQYADSTVYHNSDQTQLILEFLDKGCGIYLFSGDFKGYETKPKYYYTTAETLKHYQQWAKQIVNYISPLYLRFFIRWYVLDQICTDNLNNLPFLDQMDAVSEQQRSFPLLFQWYMQGGDLSSLPPKSLINIFSL